MLCYGCDEEGCIEGHIYGLCRKDNCLGKCELKGKCNCNCHKENDDQNDQADSY